MPPRDEDVAKLALTKEALAAWTHDLRNPLAALVANIHHLRETLAPHLDAESEEVFAECLALFGLLERYTSNLDLLAQRDASLPDRGRPVDLVDLANDVATRLGPYANVTGHRFRVLVQGAEPARVESDREVLRRLVENLASNALENAPAGPIDLVVSTRRGPRGSGESLHDEGCLAIVDQGPAWPPTATGGASHAAKRAPGSRYGRGLGVDAARLAAHVIGATIELGASPRGEASATISAPLHAALGAPRGPT